MTAGVPVADERDERDEPTWGMGDVAIALGFWLAVQLVVGAGLLATQGVSSSSTDSASALDDLSLPMVVVLVATNWVGLCTWPIIVSYRKGSRSIVRDFGVSFRISDLWVGGVGWLVTIGISAAMGALYLVLFGSGPPDNSGFLEPVATSWVTIVVLVIVVAVLTPFFEELFFRGFLLRAIGKRWGLAAGALGSSAVFGLFHFQGEGATDLYIIGLLGLYGWVWAILTVRANGRIGPAIVAHGINNGIAVAVLTLG